MMLFEGDYIEVGLEDYTDKFLDAMKNWQKFDYSYREKGSKEILQENYEYIEKEKKKGKKDEYIKKWGCTYTEDKERNYKEHLKRLENYKKWDEKRKDVEKLIQNKLRSLKRITAIVIRPHESDNTIDEIELGLKVGHVGYPHINMENDVLSIIEHQEGEFYEERQEEYTEIRWIKSLGPATYLRINKSRPFKLREWYEKLSNKSYW